MASKKTKLSEIKKLRDYRDEIHFSGEDNLGRLGTALRSMPGVAKVITYKGNPLFYDIKVELTMESGHTYKEYEKCDAFKKLSTIVYNHYLENNL